MPKIIHVDRRQLDYVWPKAAPFLEKAVEKNNGEATLDQVRMQVAFGGAELLIGVDEADNVFGAAVVEFNNHPNKRIAHISYIAGMTSRELFDQLKDWAKLMGASAIQGFGDDAIARLWQSRYKFNKLYNLVRLEL